jgi:hypothetical protein
MIEIMLETIINKVIILILVHDSVLYYMLELH